MKSGLSEIISTNFNLRVPFRQANSPSDLLLRDVCVIKRARALPSRRRRSVTFSRARERAHTDVTERRARLSAGYINRKTSNLITCKDCDTQQVNRFAANRANCRISARSRSYKLQLPSRGSVCFRSPALCVAAVALWRRAATLFRRARKKSRL